ncbi:fumarylacetoacetate hydrolase family protein [Thiomicrorhabdus hydrogeniphila]
MNSILFAGKPVYPSKIVCIGRNYAEHIAELNNETPTEPVFFIKPNSAISNKLVFSPHEAIHFEGEIVFLILKGHLAGIGFGLDLTKREKQQELKNKGLPWERAKAFDKSAVLSELVPFNRDCQGLSMELYINDVLVQKAEYNLMLHKPQAILDNASEFLTFEDHDLLMTGTPKGVGKISLGDIFYAKIMHNDLPLIEASWQVVN